MIAFVGLLGWKIAVAVSRKIRVVVRCNGTLGLPGRISSRLQPNHPRDDVAGVLASVREGLSYGNGDAVIGVNPATESVVAVVGILKGVSGTRQRREKVGREHGGGSEGQNSDRCTRGTEFHRGRVSWREWRESLRANALGIGASD
jgi:hypothetical protein